MSYLFTRDGVPLTVAGTDVFDRAGHQLARNLNGVLYSCDGRYAGSVFGDRVVYRVAESDRVIPAFAPRYFAASSMANGRPLALRGEEPFVGPVKRRLEVAPSRRVPMSWGDRFEEIISSLRIAGVGSVDRI